MGPEELGVVLRFGDFVRTTEPGLHLKLLARISRILKIDPFKDRLLNAADKDEIFEIIKEEDEEF